MSATLITWPRVPLRALVVIPAGEIDRDFVVVRLGGFAIDGGLDDIQGPLATVLRRLQDDPRGLPVTVHPECRRRAAA